MSSSGNMATLSLIAARPPTAANFVIPSRPVIKLGRRPSTLSSSHGGGDFFGDMSERQATFNTKQSLIV